MFLVEDKLQARINELNEYRYRDSKPISSFVFKVDKQGLSGQRPPSQDDWEPVEIGQCWVGRDLYVWLATTVDIPLSWKNKKVLGRFNFGKTGSGHNSGFESLLYLNGKPYQGVDSNHQEVFLPEDLKQADLVFRLWSGLEGGGLPKNQEIFLEQAEICWLDEATDDLYYTAQSILQTVFCLGENNSDRVNLLKILDQAFLVINWLTPGSEEFYHSIADAQQFLHEKLQATTKQSNITVNCIGHTHIDVAWLWQLKHTREKCARSFTTVLRLMELFPDYVFLQTQPQLYEYIKTDYPEIYQQIKEKIQEGRWEADGGMWVEADCNLSSGESLVRQLLFGTRFLEQEFDITCKYLWLPDVFGYSWALPQILRKSGIETFMTTKISWNQYNRLPHDTFNWRGIDGSEILTHFITTPSPNTNRFYTYNGVLSPQQILGLWNNYQDKTLNQELLVSYGYGDGGGGVNREMLERRRRLDKIPGLPQVKPKRVDDYFKQLHKQVEDSGQYVHTWDGELYLEYHRGTYTSQAYNKRMNRKLELFYREAEWINVIQSGLNADWKSYPTTSINEGWKIILRNQFHDIIPGSSIREVYEDSVKEYDSARTLAENAWESAVTSLVTQKDEGVYTIFNSATWNRTDLIEIPIVDGLKKGNWYGESGILQAEKLDGIWLIEVVDLPALGYATIWFSSEFEAANSKSFVVKDKSVETPFYKIAWNDKGQLTNIYDIENQREVLTSNANVFQVFEDKPIRHEAWDIDIFYQEKSEEINSLSSVNVIEVNSMRAVIRFQWTYSNSIICQDMIMYAVNRRIDFRTKVDWHDQRRLLKVAFPVDIRSTEATYDIQFGNVKRPTHWNTSWDYARFESVGHQWADLSEQGYGVSLLNDCKYGYDIKDNVIRLSLIKSAKEPDYLADQGEHIFTYSLLPHAGSWIDGETVKQAWFLNNPLKYARGKNTKERLSLFRVNKTNIIIDAVKKGEDGDKIILRFHEYTGARGQVSIESDLPISSWQECNLLEKPIGELHKDNKISLKINPYEIKTVLVNTI